MFQYLKQAGQELSRARVGDHCFGKIAKTAMVSVRTISYTVKQDKFLRVNNLCEKQLSFNSEEKTSSCRFDKLSGRKNHC